MKPSMRLFATLVLVGLSLVVAAAGLRSDEKPDGAAIYKERCSMCHGADGKGFAAIKTPDFTDSKWQAGITDEQMIETIKNGKKGTAMPAFADKLKDEEILAVVAHIRSLCPENSKKN